jgi:hypothetical protein
LAQGCAGHTLGPQQIARGDLGNSVTLDQALGLSAFARAGRTQ